MPTRLSNESLKLASDPAMAVPSAPYYLIRLQLVPALGGCIQLLRGFGGDVEAESCGSQEHQEGRRRCQETEDDLALAKEDADSARQGRGEGSPAEAPCQVALPEAGAVWLARGAPPNVRCS